MNKYFLVCILVLLSLTGFTQSATYPSFSANTLSMNDCNSQYTPYGLLFYTIHTGNTINCTFLSGEYNSNFITCLQSWMCSSILFEDNPGYYLTFGRLCLEQSSELTDPSHSNSDLKSSYGIKYGLTDNEENPSKNLLHYEKPVFDISTLHKDEVIQELLKQLRLQEFDFSGVIQEFYRPSRMPGID